MKNYSLIKYSNDFARNVQKIFNYYILYSMAAFSEEIMDIDEINSLMNKDKELPKYIAKYQNEVIGFAFAYRYHHAKVFEKVTKFTYFIMPEHTKCGLGKIFLEKLENDCRDLNIESILVHISSFNHPSINFHKKNGFKECGRFERIGRKHGQEFDDIWMQKFI